MKFRISHSVLRRMQWWFAISQLRGCQLSGRNHEREGLPLQGCAIYLQVRSKEGCCEIWYANRCTTCATNSSHTRKGGSNNITEGDENGIHQVVGTLGTVSIAYQVVSDFMFYRSGIYSSTRCKSGPMDVNHAVLVVGYDVSAKDEPYWVCYLLLQIFSLTQRFADH